MRDSARYAKIVEWSEENGCYVGRAPGLISGGCRGPDEQAVFAALCRAVDEAIEIYKRDGKPLPPPTAGTLLAGNPAPFLATGKLVTSETAGGHCDDDAY
ncbi:MAG TPA: hypothetical protein VFP36_10815 [Usitatibacter sp.]|nr:hypothetical protein [Usitatibacter sp.]